MLLQGFFNYQQDQFNNSCLDSVDSFILSKNGYIAETSFLAGRYYNVLLGIQRNDSEASVLSNLPHPLPVNSLEYSDLLYRFSDRIAISAWHDEGQCETILSREPFGSVPLFYIHVPNVFFAFSSDIRTLINLTEARKYLLPNKEKIAAYGSRRSRGFYQDTSSTFFSYIQCVLPGHIMRVTRETVSFELVVHFTPEKWSYLKSTDEYSEALRTSLSHAVQYTLRDQPATLGSHLSGGLDSSSVSSITRYLYPKAQIHTFHLSSRSKESDEEEYSLAVANQIGSTHHIIPQATNDLQALLRLTSLYGQPEASFLSPATKLTSIQYATELGCNVLLTGFGGDSVIGNGFELMYDSFQKRDWKQLDTALRMRIPYFPLAHQYKNWKSFSENQRYEIVLNNFLYRHLSGVRRSSSGLDALKLYWEISSAGLPVSLAYFLKRWLKNNLSRILRNDIPTVHTIFKEYDTASQRTEKKIHFPNAIRGNLSSDFSEVFNDVFHPHVIRGQEQNFILENHYGVSSRAPFMNRELFELNLAIPHTVKYGDGIGRMHLRDAMKGILPESVRLRSSKATLSSTDGEEMTMRLYEQSRDFLDANNEVWEYVDKNKFTQQIALANNYKIAASKKSNVYLHITRTISLSVWLDWVNKNK